MKYLGQLCILLVCLVSASAAEPESAPIVLDRIFKEPGLLGMSPKEFLARFPEIPAPEKTTAKPSGDKELIGTGRHKATLFGVPVDNTIFFFRRQALTGAYADILLRGHAVSMSQPEFEKMVAQTIAGITAMTGVPPEKEIKPDVPGSVSNQWYSWPASQYFLISSYTPADPSRNLPFRAEFIALRFPSKR